MTVEVPPNCTASVRLPRGEVSESGALVLESAQVSDSMGDGVLVEVASGVYDFVVLEGAQ